MSYSNGIQTTYVISAADLTGAAAEDLVIAGPKGKTGRVTSIVALVTTGVTVAASAIQVGISGGDLDAYASCAVPISAADSVHNTVVNGASGNRIPADTKFAISNAGGATAGVANVAVTVEWS